MSQPNDLSVLAALGLDHALRYIFAGPLTREGEEYLVAHLDELGADDLFWWLEQPELDADDGESQWLRPSSTIVSSIVAAATAPGSGYLFHGLVKRVANVHVRDELIFKLLAADPEHHWRLTGEVSGCELFRTIAKHDVLCAGGQACGRPVHEPSSGCRPSWLVEEGEHSPMVSMLLRDERPDAWRVIQRLVHVARGSDAAAAHALWLIDHLGLLDRVEAPRELVDLEIATQFELHRDRASLRKRHQARFAVQLVDRWAGDHEADVKAWFVERSLAAVKRGVPWSALWPEIPARLRDDVALASLRAGAPAPWSLRAVVNRMSGLAAWDAAFASLAGDRSRKESFDVIRETSRAYQIASYGGFPERGDEWSDTFQALDSRSDRGRLGQLALPEDADERFDERFVAAATCLELWSG